MFLALGIFAVLGYLLGSVNFVSCIMGDPRRAASEAHERERAGRGHTRGVK